MAVIIGVPPLVASVSARIGYRHRRMRHPLSNAPYRTGNALSYIYTALPQSSPISHKDLQSIYLCNHGKRF